MRKFKIDKVNLIVSGLFLIGISLLGFFATKIYERTIISWEIPTLICVLTGLLATLLLRKAHEKYSVMPGFTLQILYNTASFGGIVLYVFMALNYYSPDVNLKEYQFKILEKREGTHRTHGVHREKYPIAKINCFGMEKDMDFLLRQTDLVNKADSITMTVKKGNLGYDVIVQYEVIVD